jgi:hypothetical protein
MATENLSDDQNGSDGAPPVAPVTETIAAPVVESFAPAPAVEPVETFVSAAAPAEAAPIIEPGLVDVVATPLATIEEAVETATEAFSASFEFDTASWSRMTLALWNENATAMLEHAREISAARSFEEIVDIQTRFAHERLTAFTRQSRELFDFAKSMAAFSGALCDVTRKAA